ncbi:MAG TPA: DMT family transporter [Candidatus Caenarcaniphilales bacterium]
MQGELAALAAAFLWALASVVYGRIGQQVPPLGLNFSKGIIAIALIVATLLLQGDTVPAINSSSLGLLLLSGVVGIGLGDTVYFEALRALGARRALLLEALAPPITSVLALVFLQEILGPGAWLGIVLTVAGVAWVIGERLPDTPVHLAHPLRGVGFGLLAAVAQAGGAVLSRAALAGSDINPLWAALFRISAGVLILLVWGLARRQLGHWFKGLYAKQLLTALVLAAIGGTYLGIWLQQIALKYTAAGIAQTLTATSPLFVLPIAAAMGDVVSMRAVLGVLVAVGGIALLFSI